MPSHLIIASLACATVTFTSCAESYEPRMAVTFKFPGVQLAGRYRRDLTVDDVRQIIQLARQRADIRKPVDQIEVDSPNHANVRGGQPRKIGDVFTTFQVEKNGGRWTIVKHSINTGPVEIITD